MKIPRLKKRKDAGIVTGLGRRGNVVTRATMLGERIEEKAGLSVPTPT